MRSLIAYNRASLLNALHGDSFMTGLGESLPATSARRGLRSLIVAAAVCLLASFPGLAFGQGAGCGPVPLPGAAGPYDFLDADAVARWNIKDINSNHLAKIKPNLDEGRPYHALYELNFILIRIPNHYVAFSHLADIEQKFPGIEYEPAKAGMDDTLYFPATAECYYDRAFRFRPNDPNLRLLMAIHYHKTDRLEQAVEQYKIAESMQENSADIQYNLGLAYFDLQEYDLSAEHAERAYALGYPLPGLRNKLAEVGAWPMSAVQ